MEKSFLLNSLFLAFAHKNICSNKYMIKEINALSKVGLKRTPAPV